MNLYPIEAGNFKLDGGAMFGVVPKALWTRTNPADENNMINMAARCLLIEDGEQLVLIDTGMGNKQSDKFFGFYFMYGDNTLEGSLKKHGFGPDDITDVILSHLHFDHCGGSINWKADKSGYEPAFKNAKYWSNELHWKWATEPNGREKASFLKENIMPLKESGQLNFVPNDGEQDVLRKSRILPGIDAHFANGHTQAQMLPTVQYKGRTVVFIADLLPTHGHIPLPYVMGYDTRPLLTLEEKEIFLKEAARNDYVLFLEHDPEIECITVKETEKGVRLSESFSLSEL
ncbi:MAG: MBL fold metallo-hydrolase [Flavobacteriales bacterium]|nr:MBL fold metallo-hydrolase [Flavobacteriales bacterium]